MDKFVTIIWLQRRSNALKYPIVGDFFFFAQPRPELQYFIENLYKFGILFSYTFTCNFQSRFTRARMSVPVFLSLYGLHFVVTLLTVHSLFVFEISGVLVPSV